MSEFCLCKNYCVGFKAWFVRIASITVFLLSFSAVLFHLVEALNQCYLDNEFGSGGMQYSVSGRILFDVGPSEHLISAANHVYQFDRELTAA